MASQYAASARGEPLFPFRVQLQIKSSEAVLFYRLKSGGTSRASPVSLAFRSQITLPIISTFFIFGDISDRERRVGKHWRITAVLNERICEKDRFLREKKYRQISTARPAFTKIDTPETYIGFFLFSTIDVPLTEIKEISRPFP